MEQSIVERYTKRYGKPFKTDRNGTLYFADFKCKRCGGLGGADQWVYTGWTCYECGGSGQARKADVIKVYEPEYEAKLEEKRKQREHKRIAKLQSEADGKRKEWLSDNQFNEDGDTFLFLGNTFERKDEIKETGARFNIKLGWHINHEVEGFEFLKVNVSEVAEPTLYGYDITVDTKEMRTKASRPADEIESVYFGQIGDKFEVKCKYTYTYQYQSGRTYGYWSDDTMYIHIFKDSEGHVFKWNTANGIEADYGQEVVLKGSVKEHSEYNGTKQTVVTRCKVTGVE